MQRNAVVVVKPGLVDWSTLSARPKINRWLPCNAVATNRVCHCGSIRSVSDVISMSLTCNLQNRYLLSNLRRSQLQSLQQSQHTHTMSGGILGKHQIEKALNHERQEISSGRLKEENPLDTSLDFRRFCEACRRGDLKVCQEQISTGVNINSRDEFDYTPLILVGRNHVETWCRADLLKAYLGQSLWAL